VSGIIVGADGSAHSRRALGWAASEAALRHVPLTVISVPEIPAGLRGSGLMYLPDHIMAEHARRAVQLDVEKALAELGRPVPVTVLIRSGHPAHQLLEAARGALTCALPGGELCSTMVRGLGGRCGGGGRPCPRVGTEIM
jgi:nucleotide-binding universal stress UspA family protein